MPAVGSAPGPALEPGSGLEAEIAAKERLAQTYFDQLLRLKAEFENFRKRVDRDKPELVRLGKSEILLKLLPLYDVLKAAHEGIARQGGDAAGPLAHGMELIFKEFGKFFASEGVTVMESFGKPYDPREHDVVGTVDRPDLEEGTVVEVLQAGFLMDGRVLRHAKVRISKKPAQA